MNMLTPEDLNQIKSLLTDNNAVLRSEIRDGNAVLRSEIRDNNIVLRDGVLADVGEMIEQNVLPRLDEMGSRIYGIEAKMVTKDYLDEKLGKLRGEFVSGESGLTRRFDQRPSEA